MVSVCCFCFSCEAFWCIFHPFPKTILHVFQSIQWKQASEVPVLGPMEMNLVSLVEFLGSAMWIAAQDCTIKRTKSRRCWICCIEMPRLLVGQTQSSCHWSVHAIVAWTTFTASTSTTSVAFADGLNCCEPNETTAFPCHGWSSRDVLTFARMSPSTFSAAICGQAKSSLRKKDACHQWLWTMVNPLQYQWKNKMLRRFQHLRIQRHLVKLRHPGKGAKETQSSATFEMKSTCL